PDGTYTAITAGSLHTCALDADGAVTCWGSNTDWLRGPTGATDAPGGHFTAISAGGASSCGVRADGGVECWGDLSLVRPAA
ncbi:MAG: RCC1 domain-containing protein, partial [bacterium]|nr:RCC1 domain-containing protein [bacterium]